MSDKELASARNEALKRLVQMYPQDFYALKGDVYRERGMSVNRRMTGELKRQRDIAKAVEFLALNNVNVEDD